TGCARGSGRDRRSAGCGGLLNLDGPHALGLGQVEAALGADVRQPGFFGQAGLRVGLGPRRQEQGAERADQGERVAGAQNGERVLKREGGHRHGDPLLGSAAVYTRRAWKFTALGRGHFRGGSIPWKSGPAAESVRRAAVGAAIWGSRGSRVQKKEGQASRR